MILKIRADPGYIFETSDKITSGTLGSVIVSLDASHEEQEHSALKIYLVNLLKETVELSFQVMFFLN